ncbi:hypothetical protein GXN76_14255 [Kroppenstedtia pulmonis]|uniref:Uncharacterized protein n=1 Tax=Kroppenstedtia pulmonis TaxID=1380685 RepID=A0A7D3Y1Q3_9BACL|nr:hypothetical protein [Kroppenstedtia pulmonis]QKG85500.1 hypothetical protein GXN76_14255 [Kroppenstedtia pulmonis]
MKWKMVMIASKKLWKKPCCLQGYGMKLVEREENSCFVPGCIGSKQEE